MEPLQFNDEVINLKGIIALFSVLLKTCMTVFFTACQTFKQKGRENEKMVNL